MFFIISKILSIFLSPILWIFALVLISLFSKKRRKSRKYLLAAIILFVIFSNSFIVDEVLRVWEVPVIKTEELDDCYDVGIVLGGGMVTYDLKNDRLTYRNNIDRVLQAIELYKIGKIQKILISGGAGNIVFRNMLESVFIKRFLVNIGISENDIIIDSISDNTHENAVYSSIILDENYPEGKFLLITSAHHMRRAKACFLHEGIITTTYSTNKYAGDRRFQFEHLFIPQLINFVLWQRLTHETLGYITYAVMGYI